MSNNDHIVAVNKLFDEVAKADLYPQLLKQLQKDLHRAGIDHDIDPEIKSNNLIVELNNLLYDQLQNAFNDFLNLLYAVDVSEKEIKDFQSENIEEIAMYTTYLILKREWKKVWLRNNL
ncbi:hypothetical protein U6A24_02200 [Aquimarina gracilis]|uniref:Uncharacterized protein n=1 Tax=Aquimarina gracilis TaxID=874422 RepID=A0ABU5ZQ98_9FLAO|nr:hypothetical protein [Aquimarina gracilis]MEB3344250.1 hypothetical protein [Aquimarina gracilis]